MPFWSSLKASNSSSAAARTIGSGLEHYGTDAWRITDPTHAYFDVPADGTSPFIKLIASSNFDKHAPQPVNQERVRPLIHVRVDSDGVPGKPTQVYEPVESSLLLPSHAKTRVRVWIQEPAHSIIPLKTVAANVRAPLRISIVRILVMLLIIGVIVAFSPWSPLWRMPFNLAIPWQRMGVRVAFMVYVAWMVVSMMLLLRQGTPPSFHHRYGYTYDLNQFGHVAQALLHGHAWLDLPVPDAFAHLSNPYDPIAREQLLSREVSPIYWDYAYFQGHWYSYFGVIPVLLFFLPYQALTSIFTPGGISLHPGVPILLGLIGFVWFGLRVMLMVMRAVSKRLSLGLVSLGFTLFIITTQALYLQFQLNFYAVPSAISLSLTMMGLWLWLKTASNRERFVWRDFGLGVLCMAANLGCRPPFIFAGLLAIPIFWDELLVALRFMLDGAQRRFVQLTSMSKQDSTDTVSHNTKHRYQVTKHCNHTEARWRSFTEHLYRHMALYAVAPLIIIAVPLLAYNYARFGSVSVFGEGYQITVTDMRSYSAPLINWLTALGYYTVLPLHFIGTFPWLATSPTPFPYWQFADPLIGGFFTLTPLAICAFAVPWVTRRMHAKPIARMLVMSVPLACWVMFFDMLKAGVGWRYMIDFAWLFALASTAVIAAMAKYAQAHEGLRGTLIRSVLATGAYYTLAILLLGLFVAGRDDALIRTMPGLLFSVSSWFMPMA